MKNTDIPYVVDAAFGNEKQNCFFPNTSLLIYFYLSSYYFAKHLCQTSPYLFLFFHRLACQCIAFLSRMSEMQRESFLLKNVSLKTHRSLLVKTGMAAYSVLPAVWNEEKFGEVYSASRHTVTISGVSLPIYDRKCQVMCC